MRNTIILVDQIDHDIAAGHGRHRAIIDAPVRSITHCVGRHPRYDSARPEHLLGSNGDHHYGRSVRGDGVDTRSRARALRLRSDELSDLSVERPRLRHQIDRGAAHPNRSRIANVHYRQDAKQA